MSSNQKHPLLHTENKQTTPLLANCPKHPVAAKQATRLDDSSNNNRSKTQTTPFEDPWIFAL